MNLYHPDQPVYRGLSTNFLQALEALVDDEAKGRWWRDVLAHPELVIAVRLNSLNVYYRGGSVFLVRFVNGSVIAETHVKYLVRTKQPRLYARLANGIFGIDAEGMAWKAYEGLQTLADLMVNAALHAGPEKFGLHSMILAHPNVVDVEVSFDATGEDRQPEADDAAVAAEEVEDEAVAADIAAMLGQKPKRVQKKPPAQDRLDVATVEDRGNPGEAWLVFHEAKHFGNKELRAEGTRSPKVASQLGRYVGTIGQHGSMILHAYPRICRDLVRLDALRRKVRQQDSTTAAGTRLDPIIAEVADGTRCLQLDPRPRLVVFGFDRAQRNGIWKDHKAKLEKSALVYAVGDPTGNDAAFRYRGTPAPNAPPQPSKLPAETIFLPENAPQSVALLFDGATSSMYLCNPGPGTITQVAVTSQGVTANGPDGLLSTSVPNCALDDISLGTGRRIGGYDVMSDGDFITAYEVRFVSADGMPVSGRVYIDKGGPKGKWMPVTVKPVGPG